MGAKIVLTGGGTAGHVTPNLALIDLLVHNNWEVEYIGSKQGIEEKMVRACGIPYHGIHTGKLRRYFSLKNLTDPFMILFGSLQAYRILRRVKPNVIFSKGGFVAFPVVVAAWLNRIPVIAHESDMSPGLANRLSYPFANKICLTFEASKKWFREQKKLHVTGTPIRNELFQGEREKGLALCSFLTDRPCLLVMGGSLGSKRINECIRQSLDELTHRFQIIHICGRGNIDKTLLNHHAYFQLEYADKEFPHLLAASSIVISRSGANSVYELMALEKPHIFIPLSKNASRGDQIENANYFAKQGASIVLADESLTPSKLITLLNQMVGQEEQIKKIIHDLHIRSGTANIVDIINQYKHC